MNIERLRGAWLARSSRERRGLTAAALVVLFGVLYGAVYAPLTQRIAKLESRLPTLRAETRLMAVQVAAIERVRAQAGSRLPAHASLTQRVQASLAEGHLQAGVAHLDSSASEQVTLTMQPMSAEAWLGWLEAIERHGLKVTLCQLARDDKTAAVQVERLTLTRR